MPRIEIIPVATRREKKQFLTLPWQIYRNDPHWVPPLLHHQREMVNFTHHAFYDDADIQTFLALRDGEPCGRVAAIINHAHNRWYNEKRGFFGFFESIEDENVAGQLLDAMRDWFAQRDVRAIRGPTNPSLNYEIGLLIDGFDSAPWFMMTYNRPYYQRLIESYGFRKVQDLFAFWGHVRMLEDVSEKLGGLSRHVTERFNIQVRTLDKRHFQRDIDSFLEIYNGSLVSTWGFVPLSHGEVRKMASAMRHMIVPELTCFAEIDGKIVGVSFGLLDYNVRIKEMNGRLLPFGFLKLLRNRAGIRRIRLISTNVLPEFQSWGVGIVLVAQLVPDAIRWGIQEAEFSWVLESNDLSRKTLQKGGARLTKTYRIFDYGPADTTANAKYVRSDEL